MAVACGGKIATYWLAVNLYTLHVYITTATLQGHRLYRCMEVPGTDTTVELQPCMCSHPPVFRSQSTHDVLVASAFPVNIEKKGVPKRQLLPAAA